MLLACASTAERESGAPGVGRATDTRSDSTAVAVTEPVPSDSIPAAAPPAVSAPTPAVGATPAEGPVAVAPAAAVRRIPLLPWPFYGRRSLAALGPEGLLALRPGSPEHRLLEALDPRECAPRGEPAPDRCLFLEEGRVYGISREPASQPPRFRLEPLALLPETFAAAEVRLDSSDPDRPLLVVRP